MSEIDFPHGQFGLIMADPPWSYTMRSEKGYEKSPHKHYDCMTRDELFALRDQVIFATAEDCVLFMWGVWPMVPDALELIKEWGFTYKTGGAWHKRTSTFVPGQSNPKSAFGTGYIFRSASEPFFIATRGEPKALNRSTRNIIEAATREHSQKPDMVYPMLENLFSGPYLEMFARTSKPGWSVWGNETDKFI